MERGSVSRSTLAAQDASIRSGDWTRSWAAAGRRPALRKILAGRADFYE